MEFKDFLEMGSADGTIFGNPRNDIERYITGLRNRLTLMRPEEIEQLRPKLIELFGELQSLLQAHRRG